MLTITQWPGGEVLATVDQFKAALAIADSASDGLIADLLARASSDIAGFCRRRVDGVGMFGLHRVLQTFRPMPESVCWTDPLLYSVDYRRPRPLILDHDPVVSILSLTADGRSFVENVDFERDGMLLFRLSGISRIEWAVRRIQVEYIGGYQLPGDANPLVAGAPPLPATVVDVTLEIAKRSWFSRDRDPAILREDAPGVGRIDYALHGTNAGFALDNGLSADFAGRLRPFAWVAVG